MRQSLRLALPLAVATTLFAPPPSAARQSDSSTFELHGTVINAITGQPVSGALVQLNGQQVQFSTSDGTFSFTDVTRGQYTVTARKPGFFTHPEISRGNDWSEYLQTVPSSSDATVKLYPEGIVYGEVKNDAGDPLEGIAVRVERWDVQNGRRVSQSYGESSTDDEGNFRLSELTPGNYYIVFQQRESRRIISRNVRGRNAARYANVPTEGVGVQYYPGVADASSATPVSIGSGTQLHISQILSTLRLYRISGAIPVANLDGGLSINLFSSSGGNVGTSMRLDRQTGEFHVDSIPGGNYLLRADLWGPPAAIAEPRAKPLTAWLPISVNADINGLVLPFGNSTSIPIEVHDETSNSNSSPNGPHRVYIQMSAKNFPQLSRGSPAPRIQNDQESAGILEDLAPTTYSVEASPQFEGYVADLRCGSVDLFQDDLTIAPGAALPAIEVTLRDDGAELDGSTVQNGQPASGSVIIYSQAYPKRSILFDGGEGTFSVPNLPPGTYQVVAVKDGGNLEFTSPAVMAKYLAHATSVTLGPHGKSAVQLELQSVEAQP